MRPYPKPIHKKREFKRPAVKESVPLEITEQSTVIDWLRIHKILHTGMSVDRRWSRLYGYVPGVPDILCFDKPYGLIKNGLIPVGAAIELKRVKGGVISPEQAEWHIKLIARGWAVKVAYGADDAIKFLEACGYAEKFA